jgi:hypothetical protein
MGSPSCHSRFWICSRICSISSLSSTAACVISIAAAFECVGFAVQFLHQEIEPSPDGSALGQDAPHFIDVRGKPVQLFLDVRTQAVKGDLLPDAICDFLACQGATASEGGNQRLFEPLGQFALQRREQVRRPRAHLRNDCLDAVAALPQRRCERSAFAPARRLQGRERFVERNCGVVAQAVRVHAGR